MGKSGGFLTPKAISNRIKAKGLQKLRWYCQMCQKQCRDENGMKCHMKSEGHLRAMRVFSENPNQVLSEFSQEFEKGFLDTLSHRHGTKRVSANVVYQEYIADKHHVHMNATCWSSLTGLCKYLGKEGKCIVDETEKGWFIQYIDRDPKLIAKKAQEEQRVRSDLDEEERQRRMIENQIAAAEKRKLELNSMRCDGIDEDTSMDIDITNTALTNREQIISFNLTSKLKSSSSSSSRKMKAKSKSISFATSVGEFGDSAVIHSTSSTSNSAFPDGDEGFGDDGDGGDIEMAGDEDDEEEDANGDGEDDDDDCAEEYDGDGDGDGDVADDGDGDGDSHNVADTRNDECKTVSGENISVNNIIQEIASSTSTTKDMTTSNSSCVGRSSGSGSVNPAEDSQPLLTKTNSIVEQSSVIQTLNTSLKPISLNLKATNVKKQSSEAINQKSNTNTMSEVKNTPVSAIESLMREELRRKALLQGDISVSKPSHSLRSASVTSNSVSGLKPTSERLDHWLFPGIYVKIMSKNLAGGKFYKQKGVVEQVIEKYIGEVRVDRVLVRVDQEELQSVLPKVGHAVLIVNGPGRGKRATLTAIHEEKFNCDLRIEEGPDKCRELLGVEYEDVSKLA